MVNGKRYVGQTVQALKTRFNAHANCKKGMLISKAIQKYGKDKFRYGVIKSCASKAEMDYWEKYFIVALKSKTPYGYNMTDGGEGGSPSEETRAKMSEAQRGEKGHNFGKPMPDEISVKISMKNRGYSHYKNLQDEIAKHNLSYKRLAKLMDLSYQSISAKMNGRLRFTERDKAKLVEIFNKPIEYLLARDDGKKIEEPVRKKRQPRSAEFRANMSVVKRKDSLYKNLQDEINKRHLSYKLLAPLMGLSAAAISAKMLGKRNFTERDKIKLVEIFGKPIEYLLARDDV